MVSADSSGYKAIKSIIHAVARAGIASIAAFAVVAASTGDTAIRVVDLGLWRSSIALLGHVRQVRISSHDERAPGRVSKSTIVQKARETSRVAKYLHPS